MAPFRSRMATIAACAGTRRVSLEFIRRMASGGRWRLAFCQTSRAPKGMKHPVWFLLVKNWYQMYELQMKLKRPGPTRRQVRRRPGLTRPPVNRRPARPRIHPRPPVGHRHRARPPVRSERSSWWVLWICVKHSCALWNAEMTSSVSTESTSSTTTTTTNTTTNTSTTAETATSTTPSGVLGCPLAA